MGAFRGFLEPTAVPRGHLRLPPRLDMGSLKLDDLEFDIEREVARLRAADRGEP